MEFKKKFLCDRMCHKLGRYLRAAGYDTLLAKESDRDQSIFEKAVREDRLLLTRDRHFLEIDAKKTRVIYLKGESLDEWAEQLKNEAEVDWVYQPFSRCLRCNTLLEKTAPPAILPAFVRKTKQEFWICSECHQIFWLGSHTERMRTRLQSWNESERLTIGLGGDLMIGRLVDEYLDHHPSFSVWGDLEKLLRTTDCNMVNLETTFTRSEKAVAKVFNFKASPEKVAQLSKAAINVVNLANNHILDFSEEGLFETIQTLDKVGILHVGAGRNAKEAREAVILEKKGVRIGILGCTDNEPSWRATERKSGTFWVSLSEKNSLKESITSLRKKVDLILLSIHWGPNMQKKPLADHIGFAHELIDWGVDILHGHSAHLFQGIEIYHKKVILYDTGDFVDDYEVDPLLRNDCSFFFFLEVSRKGVHTIRLVPTLISNFQVNIAKGNLREEILAEMQKLSREFQTKFLMQDGELWIHL